MIEYEILCILFIVLKNDCFTNIVLRIVFFLIDLIFLNFLKTLYYNEVNHVS